MSNGVDRKCEAIGRLYLRSLAKDREIDNLIRKSRDKDLRREDRRNEVKELRAENKKLLEGNETLAKKLDEANASHQPNSTDLRALAYLSGVDMDGSPASIVYAAAIKIGELNNRRPKFAARLGATLYLWDDASDYNAWFERNRRECDWAMYIHGVTWNATPENAGQKEGE